MLRKICPIGNSQGVTIPKDVLEKLHLDIGSNVDVEVDEKHGKIIIEAVKKEPKVELEREFVAQVNDFVKRYKPALKALAKK